MDPGKSMLQEFDHETTDHRNHIPAHKIVRLIAQFFSFIFHPLFIPVYIAWFMLFIHPLLFAGFSDPGKMKFLGIIIVNLTFFPAITVFLLWRLKLISTIYLTTQKERIIPYAAAMIFYFWCWYVVWNFNEVPVAMKQFLLGSFITIIAAWIINIYSKISMHGLAVGAMATLIINISLEYEGASGLYALAALLVSGVVCTSRLIVSDHQPREIYAGFVTGAFCQALAIWLN
jgi:hypothetical protein